MTKSVTIKRFLNIWLACFAYVASWAFFCRNGEILAVWGYRSDLSDVVSGAGLVIQFWFLPIVGCLRQFGFEPSFSATLAIAFGSGSALTLLTAGFVEIWPRSFKPILWFFLSMALVCVLMQVRDVVILREMKENIGPA